MSASAERVRRAFAHQEPDRTPLFELFNAHHPIHWDICGHTVATDAEMAWDAMADGINGDELFEACVLAQYQLNRYFGLDMVRLYGAPRQYTRPVRTGPRRWTLDGVPYRYDERTDLVVLETPAAEASYSHRYSEADLRRQIESWDGKAPPVPAQDDPVLCSVRALAQRDGVEWVYMGEIGAGTGVAFYPPFMLMWMIEEPDLLRRWIDMQKASAFAHTRAQVRAGCTVIALGGDVSCDKGPFISPALYREFILPVIQEHVDLVHQLGAQAVYTSDGNHWPIKQEFFFDSRIDGYKEVDQAAGMTWPRLISEGVSQRVCILGNLDARHTFCHGSTQDVQREVRQCLDYGRQSPGGHILHLSHSVHEDVKVENYRAAVQAYRQYFGVGPLP